MNFLNQEVKSRANKQEQKYLWGINQEKQDTGKCRHYSFQLFLEGTFIKYEDNIIMPWGKIWSLMFWLYVNLGRKVYCECQIYTNFSFPWSEKIKINFILLGMGDRFIVWIKI